MPAYRTKPRTVAALRVEEVRPATGDGRLGRWATLVLEDGTLRQATRHLCGGIVPGPGDYVVAGLGPWEVLVWRPHFLERFEPVEEPAQEGWWWGSSALRSRWHGEITDMRATVWTADHIRPAPNHESRPRKCIFDGVIDEVPRADDRIIVRPGFGAETVQCVIYDLTHSEVEIRVAASDPEDEYGPCLLYGDD